MTSLMEPSDLFWHGLHLVLPAFLTAAVAAGLAKGLWRRELRGVRWLRLAGWGSAAGVLALIGGLIAFGRDGRMATYGLLVLFNAIALAWAGRPPVTPSKKPNAGSR